WVDCARHNPTTIVRDDFTAFRTGTRDYFDRVAVLLSILKGTQSCVVGRLAVDMVVMKMELDHVARLNGFPAACALNYRRLYTIGTVLAINHLGTLERYLVSTLEPVADLAGTPGLMVRKRECHAYSDDKHCEKPRAYVHVFPHHTLLLNLKRAFSHYTPGPE